VQGNARDAVKALIVANEFLEAQVSNYKPPSRMVTHAASLNLYRATARIGMIE
jgi:hypothetical protein